MRADRLVSILMLLQTRGKMSARELAEALEVSERTIYRDINALSQSGIPVYTERGADGGCCLVEDYTTNLTGLTEDEARALSLLAAPGPLDSLDVGQKLKAAMRKLYASLPQYRGATAPSIRLHLDWAWWGQAAALPGQLEQLYQAAQSAQTVRISYRLWGGTEVFLAVHPLGLVAKAGQWFLVYEINQKVRAQRFNELLSIELMDEKFNYPVDFDLAEYWQKTCAKIESEHPDYTVVLQAQSAARQALAHKLGNRGIQELTPLDENGWVKLSVAFESFEAARDSLLALGGSVEVIEPLALRLSVQDYACQTLNRYSPA